MTKKYDLVVFDYDGTMVDTMPAYITKATELFVEHYGLSEPVARQEYLSTTGRPFLKQVEMLFPLNGHNSIVIRRFEEFKKGIRGQTRWFPGVPMMLQTLRNAEVRTGIISSTEKEYMLTQVEVDFSLGRGLYDDKATQLDVLVNEHPSCLFVGDSLYDAEVAEKVGVDFCGVATTLTMGKFLDKGLRVVPTISYIPKEVISA